MGPRAGFAISLFAACAIHAAILLVPHAAFVGETRVLPSIVIDLSASAPSAARAAPPTPVSQEPVGVPVETPAETPAETPEAAPPAAVLAPEPGVTDVPPAGSTGGAVAASEGTGAPVEGNDSSATRGGTERGAAVRVSAPTLATDFSAPAPLTPIQPAYPQAARRSGAQGLVKVGAIVSESGAATAIEVVLSSGSALLDGAAVEAVRRAAFVPAHRNGLAFACRIVVPIRFQLSRP
jgi:protein TonB